MTLNKLLKTFFNYAIGEDYILKNPSMKIVILGDATEVEEDAEEIMVLSNEEINKVKEALKGKEIEMLLEII